MLDAEAQKTSIMSHKWINIVKGEGLKTDKWVVPLIEASLEEFSVNEERDTMEWLSKWHHREQQEKWQLRKYQELLMG